MTDRISPFIVRRAGRALAACASLLLLAAAARASFVNVSLNLPAWSTLPGRPTAGTVKLSASSAGVVVVSISSTNPAVAAVATSSVPFQPGATQMSFVVQGVAPGCTEFRSRIGTQDSGREHLVVHPANPDTALKLTVPEQLIVSGGRATASVMTGDRSATAVTLTSSDPSAASVPSSVTLSRGAASFSINGAGAPVGGWRCAQITASYTDVRRVVHKVSKTVLVMDIGG